MAAPKADLEHHRGRLRDGGEGGRGERRREHHEHKGEVGEDRPRTRFEARAHGWEERLVAQAE